MWGCCVHRLSGKKYNSASFGGRNFFLGQNGVEIQVKMIEMNEQRNRNSKSRIRTKLKEPDKAKSIERD